MNVFSHSLNMKKLNFYSKISTQNGLSKWMLKWTRSYHIAFFQHTGRNCKSFEYPPVALKASNMDALSGHPHYP